MRTTIPLLQSAAAATTTTTTTTTPPTTTVLSLCLRTLHGTHLQRIAQRTGIHSSGTKPVLTRRLETELPQCEYQRAPSAGAPAPAAQGMSILSIDMGIRNLAFAHLLVAPPPPTPPLHSSGALKREEDAGDRHRPRITLTAWRRLSVFAPDSDFELQSQEPSQLHPETAVPLTTQNQTQTQTQIPDEASEPTEAHPPPSDPAPASDLDPDLDPDPSPEEEAGKVIGPYCPASYAEAAYALITTLLARYRPTHVLIERQRFRSGGRAPVQEWSIRVGVFEGMLYAVLEALRHERGAHPNSNSNSNSHAVGGPGPGPVPVPVPQVYGVEPGRVSRFWSGRVSPIHGEGEGKATGERKRRRRKVQQQQQQQTPPPPQADAPATAEDGAAEAATERPARKKKKSAGEVKKMKMDLVGHWLQNAAAATTTTTTSSSSSSLAVADDQELHQWVEAYRTRWQTRRGAGAHLPEIGKLDDLADCLVQGVTWLEWQQMRHRLLVEPSLLLKI
ncbi:ribonuclease H-like protein [Aspergillus japonicus CBS 114.51]|uniref:Ribonuclease H-like protein n=1 Tax=Aspergillus japonicus CBS 114.51 TaxID=1448312 RepID=A0A8T8X3I2_ASPJA|nr:ribonuclease H-like protein [Aspergillus japonicus CBS 114.51]RAH82636.1 ribonuclease H-like protein [Aspergillus japonicus CBS 114.51]